MHPGQRALIAQINRELAREWAEERAAILEYEAGLTRAEAEAAVRARACPVNAEPVVGSGA